MANRVRYFMRSLGHYFNPNRYLCPNCGGNNSSVVMKKYFVTQLHRCANCALMYRTPTETGRQNARYYNKFYKQGFTTEIPDDGKLAEYMENGFAGTGKDWGYYNRVLFNLGLRQQNKLLDYGCSWGYGSYQMQKSGFDVLAYDISCEKREFIRNKFHLPVIEDLDKFLQENRGEGQLDCFFMAHVLEHLPCPGNAFALAKKLLKPGGIIVSFTPNGCESARRIFPEWPKWWGEVHPNLIDDQFLNSVFSDCSSVIASKVDGRVQFADRPGMIYLDNLQGAELMFAARVN